MTKLYLPGKAGGSWFFKLESLGTIKIKGLRDNKLLK
jgi:hypothetical protein